MSIARRASTACTHSHTALIGAPNDETGSAYIFERDPGGPGNWEEVGKLTAADGDEGHLFGAAAAISGDIAIVGSVFDDHAGEESGSAYIFQRDHGGVDNWGEVAKLTASDSAPGQRFGISVALDGDLALVGAFFHYRHPLREGSA